MAESNRRGEDAAAEHSEESGADVFDDAIDDDAKSDTRADDRKAVPAGRFKTKVDDKGSRVGFFGRIGRFIREVVAELRKVIWPTRTELLTYTAVVLVFLVVMVAIVAGFDQIYARGVLLIFGNPS